MAEQAAPYLPSASPLVGRERELAALRDALDAAIAGRGSLVLIGGEAGIGKTALAEALCREASDQGALVLVGRCYDLSETPPYGPWAEALAVADQPSPLDLGGERVASQAALFAQVRELLAALAARQPLVLLLEDLHWADPASLDLLRVTGRHLGNFPLLLLATYRTEEVARRHPLYQSLPALVREARAARLDLHPLDVASVRDMVRGQYTLPPTDEARLVDHLQAHAEGNPFYAGELLRSLEEGRLLCQGTGSGILGDLAGARVPPLLRQVIDRRVDRLGEEARGLLVTAAVIGQEVPLDLWQAVAGVGDAPIAAAVERAVQARILAEGPTPDRVRFAHALVREALYEAGSAPQRRHAHRHAAETLAATPAPAGGYLSDPDAVAHHFRQAGDPRAVGWFIAAAERALRAYARLTAAERCEAALVLLRGDPARVREHGWLAFHVARLRRYDDPGGGLDHLATAARLATEAGDAALAAYALAQRGVLRTILGAPRRGLADLEAGVAALAALPPDAVLVPPPAEAETTPAYYSSQQAIWLAGVGRYGEALAAAERMVAAWASAAPPADVPLAPVYRARGMAYAALGHPARAGQEFARARAAIRVPWTPAASSNVSASEAVWVALPYQADRPAVRRALVAEVNQIVASADRAAEVNQALANADRAALAGWLQQIHLVPLLLVEGAWAGARTLADTLLALLAERRAGLLERLALGAAGDLAHEQGDEDRVHWLLDEALPGGPDTPPGDTVFVPALALQRLAARRALEAGDLPATRAWLACHDRWLAWSGSVLGRAEGQLGWAAYHRAAGDLDAARDHAEAALAHASDPRQPLALLAAHRALGELATDAGNRAEATAHLDAALALAEACAAPYERALTLLALAGLHMADGETAGARARLDAARAICLPLGAAPALARIAALRTCRAAAGAAPPRPDGLSRREAEVLRLLATGCSNGQVARALFVSPRTVKRHIANAYHKIGAHNRAEATAYALRHGLV